MNEKLTKNIYILRIILPQDGVNMKIHKWLLLEQKL